MRTRQKTFVFRIDSTNLAEAEQRINENINEFLKDKVLVDIKIGTAVAYSVFYVVLYQDFAADMAEEKEHNDKIAKEAKELVGKGPLW